MSLPSAPGSVKRVIEVGANAYVPAVKVAFQAKRRITRFTAASAGPVATSPSSGIPRLRQMIEAMAREEQEARARQEARDKQAADTTPEDPPESEVLEVYYREE